MSASPSPPSPPSPRKKRALLLRLLGLAWERRRLAALALLFAVLAESLTLAGLVFSGLAIDVVRQFSSHSAPAVEWPFGLAPPAKWEVFERVALAAALVLVFTLLRAVVHYFARTTDERLIQSIIVTLRTRMYDKLQRMSFGYFNRQDSGGLINRVTGDAQSVRRFIQGVILQLVIAIITMAIFVGYMLQAHIGLTLATLAVIPLQALVMWSYTRTIQPRFKEMRESMDRLIQFMQESIIGAQVIKGFGQERQMTRRFGERNDDASTTRMTIAKAASTHMPAMPASAFLQLAILLGYGGWLVKLGPAQGGIALGTMWVFLSLLRQLANQIDEIVSSASSIPEALTGAERVFELLDAPVGIVSPAAEDGDRGAAGGRLDAMKGEITFENVSFRYNEAEPPILENINLTIRPGETIALVGPAGAGKSTLLQLVPRFYEATSGRIMIDGIDVRDWPLTALRRQIAVVFQEPFLFSNTIHANVAFGRMDASDTRLRQALDDAAALDFVSAAPYGMETIIGERGLTLSGGERQRLTLARALIADPPVLLLDDATASVDARTEAHIQAALQRVMRGRTTIIIAHRLSTLRRADRIVVIEHGRITAIGAHHELIRTNEHYRRSSELQLERERAEATSNGEFDDAADRNGDAAIDTPVKLGSAPAIVDEAEDEAASDIREAQP